MFGFLKDKIKEAVKKLTKDVDEQAREAVEPVPSEQAKTPAEEKVAHEVMARRKRGTAHKKEAIPKTIGKEERKERGPTDVLYEEETPEEAAQPQAKEAVIESDVIAKIEKEEGQEEERKVESLIKSIEEETEHRGFFGRIKDVFSKKGHEKEVEEEKAVTHALLGEGLTKEEKRFVNEQTGGREGKTPKAVQGAVEPLAEQGIKAQEEIVEEPEEKGGLFARIAKAITTKTLTEKQFDEIFWDLEVALLEANVAVEVIEKIKADLKASLVDKQLARSKIGQTISATLAQSMEDLFDAFPIPLLDRIGEKKRTKKPYVIAFFGVNGAGKTTTIAKIAHYLKKNGNSVVLAASDTFRAAAIQQLEEHANRLGVKIIKHDYGADAAAVGFDAIKYAEAKNIDVVLIDTAGRMHSNVNLMDELAKIIRVCKPNLSLFVGESITGNDCIEQARQFNEAVGIDGIILTKADVDEKGGAAVSVSYVTKKPILFLGMGQGYDDLKPFEKRIVLNSLGLS